MATSGVLSFGRISEFQPELQSIETYKQRVRMFLQANNVTDKAVPVLLSIIGASNFALLSSLLAPEKPADKTVDELLETLRTHFTQKRVTIAERYKFYNRSQGQDESAAQFAGELRRLATHCNFGSFLEQALRDCFVCGLKNAAAQKKLLSGVDKADGDKLTFKMAIETASTMETVETDLQELNLRKNHNPVLQVQPRNKTCSRRSREGHEPSNCRFRSATCQACGRRGHIQVACRTNGFAKQQRKAPVRRLQDETGPDSEEDEASSEDIGVFKLYANSVRSAPPPVVVEVVLNGKRVTMEVDTGAAVSLISEYTYRKYLRAVPLAPTDLQLHTYTDEKLEVQGKCSVSIEYRGQVGQVSIYVVAGRGPSLLGRDILQSISSWTGSVSS